MTDPRVPESKQKEAELPDALDQSAGAGLSAGLFGQHGSEDAQLLAGAGREEGDIEREAPSEKE
jgi:hypothetical protein